MSQPSKPFLSGQSFFQRNLWNLSIFLICAVSVGAYVYYNHQRYKHFAVHQEGMVYRSAWLEPDVLSELIEKYQFRSVVNLCAPGEMGEERWQGERDAVNGAGAKLIELPMPFVVEPGDTIVQKHIEMFSDPNNFPMLIHCQHGVTRTAKELALYDMIFQGMSCEQSLKRMPLFGREDHNVNVWGFARDFETKYASKWRVAKEHSLDVLQR
jgi:hypothetical protein